MQSSPPPRRVQYPGRKSRRGPSPSVEISMTDLPSTDNDRGREIEYRDTLGRCHLETEDSRFRWFSEGTVEDFLRSSFLGYNEGLGRVYFSSFNFDGELIQVGDFILKQKQGSRYFFRIIGAFQATKSFLGGWEQKKRRGKNPVSGKKMIQKRGHPQIVLVPLHHISDVERCIMSRRKRANLGGEGNAGQGTGANELVLVSDSNAPNNVHILPGWLDDDGVSLSKIRVQIGNNDGPKIGSIGMESLDETYICRKALLDQDPSKRRRSKAKRPNPPGYSDLNDNQCRLLTCPPNELLHDFIPLTWDQKFDAVQVQFVCKGRDWDSLAKHNASWKKNSSEAYLHYTNESSDDSDEFEANEEESIKSKKKKKKKKSSGELENSDDDDDHDDDDHDEGGDDDDDDKKARRLIKNKRIKKMEAKGRGGTKQGREEQPAREEREREEEAERTETGKPQNADKLGNGLFESGDEDDAGDKRARPESRAAEAKGRRSEPSASSKNNHGEEHNLSSSSAHGGRSSKRRSSEIAGPDTVVASKHRRNASNAPNLDGFNALPPAERPTTGHAMSANREEVPAALLNQQDQEGVSPSSAETSPSAAENSCASEGWSSPQDAGIDDNAEGPSSDDASASSAARDVGSRSTTTKKCGLSYSAGQEKRPWTEREHDLLCKAVAEARQKHGTLMEELWQTLAAEVLPQRTATAIQGRWYYLEKNGDKRAQARRRLRQARSATNGAAADPSKRRQAAPNCSSSRRNTPARSAKNAAAGDPDERRQAPNCNGSKHGMQKVPKSSNDWIQPWAELLPPSSAPLKKTSVRAMYHERLLTVPRVSEDDATHSFVLSVDTSTIPNAGRGLFLTYRGPDTIWRVPGYVDLGCYGPHRAADIKKDFLMEVKNFVFRDRPSEWSFDGFLGINEPESTQGPLTLYGKDLVKDVIFDITDDETGEVHKVAEQTLLPFVNEVTVQKGKSGKGMTGRLREVQNIDAVHHDDGSLHYLLRAGSTFEQGQTTELFVYYGQKYEGNRERKHDAYGGKAKANDAGPMQHSSILTVTDNDDLSTLSCSDENEHGSKSDEGTGGVAATAPGQDVVTTVCSNCNEKSLLLCSKTPISTSQYTNMRSSILTYTEDDVVKVLDLFLESPPIESVARHRMWWVIDMMRPYLKNVLFRRSTTVSQEILEKLGRANNLFPRGNDSPYYEEDMKIMNTYQYLGIAIRKKDSASGFKTGLVEQVLFKGAAHSPVGQKKYLVQYFIGEGQEVLTEAEVLGSCVEHCLLMA